MSVLTLPRPQARWRAPSSSLTLGLVAILLIGYIMTSIVSPDPSHSTSIVVPQSPALEAATGVRFSRAAVVGDGGLVMVEYVVLDVEKATAFQEDVEHVPTLYSEARNASTHWVSIMKPGHLIRAGQTYYLVYKDTLGGINSGETITLRYLDHALPHIPVL